MTEANIPSTMSSRTAATEPAISMPIPRRISPSSMNAEAYGEANYALCNSSYDLLRAGRPPSDSQPCLSQDDERILKLKTKGARQRAVIEQCSIPSHWKAPSSTLGCVLFYTMSLFAFGHLGLEPIWASIKLEEKGDESLWEKRLQHMSDRLSNLNVTAGLLLATCATFLTTPPPFAHLSNYVARGPYICLGGAFALLVLGIIVGSTILHLSPEVSPKWWQEVLFKDTLRVHGALLLLAYPFLAVGVATLLLAFGLITAIWVAHDHQVQIGGVILTIALISAVALFALLSSSWRRWHSRKLHA